MIKFTRLFFLAFLLAFTTQCDDEEEITPRRISDTGLAQIFAGSFEPSPSPAAFCPTGDGAIIEVNFEQQFFDVLVPQNNVGGSASLALSQLNSSKLSEADPVVDNSSGNFQLQYVELDINDAFSTSACSDAGDVYDSKVRLSVVGNLNEDNEINFTYNIFNLCQNDSVTSAVCNGVFLQSN